MLQNTLPEAIGRYETAGEFMAPPLPAQAPVAMVEGKTEALPVNEVPQQSLTQLIHLLYAESLQDQYNPLIEALFMGMRGHNKQLMKREEPHNQACTDLGLMREMAAIPVLNGVGSDM